jgi:asparaginyl-tRNA synthetase
MRDSISIRRLRGHLGETVTLRGWVVGKRSSGKIHFVQFRDGSGVVQAVASRNDVDERAWGSSSAPPRSRR